MVALKAKYNELIVSPQQEEEEEDNAMADVMKQVQEGYGTFDTLCNRFTQTYGVSKFKGEMLSALVTFVQVGIDFALTDNLHYGFCKAIIAYLRFLPASVMSDLSKYLEDSVVDNDDLLAELDDMRNASIEVKALWALRCNLGGTRAKARLPRRRLLSHNTPESITSSSTARRTNEEQDELRVETLNERGMIKVVAGRGNPTKKIAAMEKPISTRVSSRISALQSVTEGDDRSIVEDISNDEKEAEERYHSAPSKSPLSNESVSPVKRSELPDKPDVNFWPVEMTSGLKRKYSSRTMEERRRISSDLILPTLPRTPVAIGSMQYASGLHIEDIDVSPIGSDDSAQKPAKGPRSGGRDREMKETAHLEEEEEADVEEVLAEIKLAPVRKRNR
jgi:hypothetical protein